MRRRDPAAARNLDAPFIIRPCCSTTPLLFTSDRACKFFCLSFSLIFVSCVEVNAMLIHTCPQEVWQLRDRIARLIWFRRDLFIGSRLAQRVSRTPPQNNLAVCRTETRLPEQQQRLRRQQKGTRGEATGKGTGNSTPTRLCKKVLIYFLAWVNDQEQGGAAINSLEDSKYETPSCPHYLSLHPAPNRSYFSSLVKISQFIRYNPAP